MAQPTNDGPGLRTRDTMGMVPAVLCFPLGWGGADPELDRQAYMVSTPSSGFPSHWTQLEDWTEPVRKRFPGAGQQKAWVLILVSDSQRALRDAAGPGWAAPPATTTRIQASARRPHQIRIKDGQHVSCGPL